MLRYPLGVQTFCKIRENDNVYVDKTDIIYKLINSYNYVFLARPRRFGKSLLLSTIQAYFEGKKNLFEGLKIYELETRWETNPVIHLQLSASNALNPESLIELIDEQFTTLEKKFNLEKEFETLSARFRNLIRRIYKTTSQKVVVLIDEYDNPLVNTIHLKDIHNENKALLKSIYSNLKDMDQFIKFVMITGVSQFTNTSLFSGLNNLTDITFDSAYTSICGFTESEIKNCLNEGVIKLSESLELTYDDTLKVLKKEYDGYHFSKDLTDIYNPFSLLNCLAKRELGNYWVRSGTPAFLIEKLKEIPALSFSKIFNGKASELELSARDTIFSSPLALMYQTGYLTIKDYDKKRQIYKLGIPNQEIEKSLGSELFLRYFTEGTEMQNSLIYEMSDFLQEGKPDEFFKRLKSFLAGVPGVINHRDMVELNFENTIYVLMMTMGADIRAEQSVATGRIDLLIKTDNFIYVIELKFNSTPKKALEQIEKKEYSLAYEFDGRKIFKIGVNFSSKTRNITGWKILEN